MPDEAPKYTIGGDYDRDGDISANTDPIWEFSVYLAGVHKGAIDMGFKLNHFERYIEGLPKERRSKSQIAPFVNAVYDALEQKNWYAALALALTLPDICGDLEKSNRMVGERYIQWWNTYLAPRYNSFLSGDDCYALRCSFLHHGLSDITKRPARKVLTDFRFVHPDPNAPTTHCNRIQAAGHHVLQLQVNWFCNDICAGVEKWERKKLLKDPEIQKRASKMLVILPPQMF